MRNIAVDGYAGLEGQKDVEMGTELSVDQHVIRVGSCLKAIQFRESRQAKSSHVIRIPHTDTEHEL